MGRRKVKKEVKRVYFDYSLLFITIFLAAFGIVMIYSTSSYTAQMNYGSSEYYFYKQLTYTLIGFAGMYITYKFDYHFWQRIWKWVMAFGIIIMFALIPFGSVVNGAKRWIRFLGIGVQPADVVKVVVIIVTAVLICSYGKKMHKFRYVLLVIAVTGGLFALLVFVISNNLSSAIIVFLIPCIMTFVAYPGYKIYVALAAAAGAVGVFAYNKLPEMVHIAEAKNDFRFNRLMVWLDPEKYASGTGYQTVQALYAIGSGGLFGKGLGKSLQKLGFIPESQNDMIFSIICEELGLFGAVCIILVFMLMLWRIIHVSRNAPDLFGSMLSVGVFAHIAIQVILNIAVVTNFIPNTGVSLPFISYGGTSMVILLCEVGMVLNISSKIKLER